MGTTTTTTEYDDFIVDLTPLKIRFDVRIHGNSHRKFADHYQYQLPATEDFFVIQINPRWAPIGARRLKHLEKQGFYDNSYFFRSFKKFLVQFGVSGNAELNKKWLHKFLPDDPRHPKSSHTAGIMSFVSMKTPNTRSTQLFIMLEDRPLLDDFNFRPIGKVLEGPGFGAGMALVRKLFRYPHQQQPEQSRIELDGNIYLKSFFPELSELVSASIVKEGGYMDFIDEEEAIIHKDL